MRLGPHCETGTQKGWEAAQCGLRAHSAGFCPKIIRFKLLPFVSTTPQPAPSFEIANKDAYLSVRANERVEG